RCGLGGLLQSRKIGPLWVRPGGVIGATLFVFQKLAIAGFTIVVLVRAAHTSGAIHTFTIIVGNSLFANGTSDTGAGRAHGDSTHIRRRIDAAVVAGEGLASGIFHIVALTAKRF